ncbi:MAG: DUF4912 domain-containing protein [Candidatus Omnitrophica bacterium]|nr:DUF4912 domain-containing protein [Candidatus Omnitrophota bacterium]
MRKKTSRSPKKTRTVNKKVTKKSTIAKPAKKKIVKKVAKKKVTKKKTVKKTIQRVAKKTTKKLIKKVTERTGLRNSFSSRTAKDVAATVASIVSIPKNKEYSEEMKFSPEAAVAASEVAPQKMQYNLPLKYADDRIVLLVRDPWWMFTYWDISPNRIDGVLATIDSDERNNLKWIVRAYELSGVKKFNGRNANLSFDTEIYLDGGSWYINTNQPGGLWCIEIGLISDLGNFYPVARSNIVGSPRFGISSNIDEHWASEDDDHFKILGIYDLGRSSMERKRKFEEIVKKTVSSPLASWGMSSPGGIKKEDKFFLEVWTEVILHGRTMADAKVNVDGKEVTLRDDGTFTQRYALVEGDFEYKVVGVSKNKKHKIKKTPAVKRYNK